VPLHPFTSGQQQIQLWKPFVPLKNLTMDKSEGRRPLGRPRRRWEDNIKKDLQEVGYGSMDWIELAQDRDKWRVLVNAVMNLWAP